MTNSQENKNENQRKDVKDQKECITSMIVNELELNNIFIRIGFILFTKLLYSKSLV